MKSTTGLSARPAFYAAPSIDPVREESMRRGGWIGLGIATMIALALRAWGWSAIGIDHFDEGVYAFTGLAWSDATQPLGAYPDQVLFSPPVYPFLVSLVFRAFGPSAAAAIGVNVLVGVSTVLIVGLVAKRWFGWQAGVAAALLLATDPLHLILSRAALTDAVFLLFFILALAAWVETLRTRAWIWAVSAGLLTGLAWNTKYHGWFVLLIAGWGLLAAAWEAREDRELVLRLGKLWLVMTGAAAACYVPWALHVHGEIGYPSLLAYQRTNVTSQFWDNLRRQLGQQAFIETSWSRLGPGIAVVAVLALRSAVSRNRLWIAAGILLAGVTLGHGLVVFLLLLIVLVLGLRVGVPAPAWLLGGLTALWLVLAPLYDPYARLLLPLWAAAAIGSGWAISRFVGTESFPENPGERALTTDGPPAALVRETRSKAALFAVLLIVSGLLTTFLQRGRPQSPWRPSDRMEHAANALALSVPEGERVIVLAEPALAFYLHQLGRPAFERQDLPEEIAGVSDTVFVTASRYVRMVPYLRENVLDALAPRLTVIDTVPIVPRDLRLLDDLSPSATTEYLTDLTDQFDVVLFRMVRDPSA